MRKYDRKIVLEDGSEYYGFGFGSPVDRVRRKLSDGSNEILTSIRAGYVSYILNTQSLVSGSHHADGMAIRQCAVQNGVNMFTSLDTARILLDALEEVIPEISTIHRSKAPPVPAAAAVRAGGETRFPGLCFWDGLAIIQKSSGHMSRREYSYAG